MSTKTLSTPLLKAALLTAILLDATLSLLGVTASHALDVPSAQPPLLLSQTGLYLAGSTTEIDPRNLPFSPQYALWSDGAVKSRWIYLPAGQPIDGSDPDSWVFPAGTKFWKQFVFGGRRTETRLLWLGPDQKWRFAAYQWRADDSDAELAPDAGVLDCQPIDGNKFHSIPSVSQCQACHSAGGNGILGFNAMQLSPDRDPLAPRAEPLAGNMVTLTTLAAEWWIANFPVAHLDSPPRIQSDNPRTRAVLGYLAANCGGCHNSEGPLRHLGLDLRKSLSVKWQSVNGQDDEADLVASLDNVADYAIPTAPPGATRWITPGAPELSSIVHRMSSRRPLSQMPPLGTALVDREAVDLIKKWVVEDLAP